MGRRRVRTGDHRHASFRPVVVRLQQSPREAIEQLKDQLGNTGAPVLGIVINGVETPSDSTYYRGQQPTGDFAKRAADANKQQTQQQADSGAERAPAQG